MSYNYLRRLLSEIPKVYEGGSPLLTNFTVLVLPYLNELAASGKIDKATIFGRRLLLHHVPTGFNIVLVGDKIYLEPGSEAKFKRFLNFVKKLIDRIRGFRISPLVRSTLLGAIKPANVTIYEGSRQYVRNGYIIDLTDLASVRNPELLRLIYETLREESPDLARLYALLAGFITGVRLE